MNCLKKLFLLQGHNNLSLRFPLKASCLPVPIRFKINQKWIFWYGVQLLSFPMWTAVLCLSTKVPHFKSDTCEGSVPNRCCSIDHVVWPHLSTKRMKFFLVPLFFHTLERVLPKLCKMSVTWLQNYAWIPKSFSQNEHLCIPFLHELLEYLACWIM